MKVLELVNLHRKYIPLYYRKEFTGDAVFELMNRRMERPVEFVVEKKPFGGVDVSVHILADIEYPIVPLINGLKTYIADLESKGKLP